MKQKIYLVFALLSVVLIPFWVFFIAHFFVQLPDDFSYEANVVSLDNFYDEESSSFLGDQRSVTTFSYRVDSVEDNRLVLNNAFRVRTIDGDPIFSVDRKYAVDRLSQAHDSDLGDQPREGYLFAPPGLKQGDEFTYWHVNYDAPAKMSFVAEEVLLGLKVFKYETRYEDQVVDQTDNLTSLPEVGEIRGVILEPHLELWVEPVTGRMVKYQDDTVAYFYDLATGERLFPWNSFSNTFERSSVRDQVALANQQKIVYFLVYYLVPLFFAFAAVAFLLLYFKKAIFALLILLLFFVSAGGFYAYETFFLLDSDQLRIGISRWAPYGNTSYDVNIEGFKTAMTQAGYIEGKDVEYVERNAGVDSDVQKEIARFYDDGDFDLIFSQTTPGTLILKDIISDIPIVFSIVTYPVEAGLIDSLDSSGNNLVGTRNWVSVDEQFSIFKDLFPSVSTIGFVHRTGEPNSEIQLAEMKRLAEKTGFEVVEIDGLNLDELQTSLENVTGVDSLYSACDTLVQGEAEEVIIEYAKKNNMPSFSCNESGPRKGDLLGVVADFYEIGRLAGEKAALILNGASPESLTTNTVVSPFVYINATTADMLGISIPQDIRVEATEIIR